jgi:uncharacterized RDD family membrane protein YckC
MKCPKCHYISFDSSERCRNCGYEFSLAVGAEGFDLPIQTGQEAIGPLTDLTLGHDDQSAGAGASGSPPQPRPITSSFDLPLFKERRREDDAPLVAPPAVPRAPLAVRRSSPLPRGANRTTADEPVLDLEAPSPFERLTSRRAGVPAPAPARGDSEPLAASVGPRFLAALVDAIILGSIGLAVLYLTLKVCGLQFAHVAVIPPVPFTAFLLLVAVGYLTLFTAAGGQTIGKMAAGIKVVSTDVHHLRVPLGQSVVRAAAYLASALPAGLGFLPAVLGADRRAIHDRLADTRVVKA